MKRSYLKRKTPLKSRVTPLKRSRKRSLRINGVTDVSVLKREIQALLRQIAIKRDGGCVLARFSSTVGACDSVLQAEHLISRANSATYADTRNIACLCRRHHIFWKPQNSHTYWELIRTAIGERRWAWYTLAKENHTPYHMAKGDWVITKQALEEELKEYGN